MIDFKTGRRLSMKLTTILALAVMTSACATYPTTVSADHGGFDRGGLQRGGANGMVTYTDFAKIHSVEEVYRTVRTPRHTDCHYDHSTNYHNSDHNIANELMGAIIGGVIGNQIGNHDAGATVAGAVVGGVIANNMEDGHAHSSNQRHCNTTYHETTTRELSHYRVTYEYGGKTFVLRQRNKPPFNHQKVAITIQLTR